MPPQFFGEKSITLLNADGSSLSLIGTTTAQVALNGLDTHGNFTVVNELSTPVILGCDFLLKHGVLLDIGKSTFYCKNSCVKPKRFNIPTEHLNVLVLDDDLIQAVPCPVQQSFQIVIDMPKNFNPDLESVLKDHETLFRCQLGKQMRPDM